MKKAQSFGKTPRFWAFVFLLNFHILYSRNVEYGKFAIGVFHSMEPVKINQNVFLCETGIIPAHFYRYDK